MQVSLQFRPALQQCGDIGLRHDRLQERADQLAQPAPQSGPGQPAEATGLLDTAVSASLRAGEISVEDARVRAELAKQFMNGVRLVVNAQTLLAQRAKQIAAAT